MNYGALKSIPKNTTINGQPHQLSYINPQEAALLKSIGGAGKNVNGVPAYFFFGGSTGFGSFGDSVASSISSGASAVSDFVSDAGQAAATFISDTATDIYQGTANVLTPFDDEEYVDGVLTNTTTNLPVTSTDTTSTPTTSTKTFDEAFAEARGAGLEMFSWQGNFYNTNLAPVASVAQGATADPANLQNIDAQLDALRSQGFTANDPPVKALLDQRNNELANLGDKLSEGEDQVQAYIDKFGTSYLEDRFLTGRINPNTGLPYEPRDTNIVNPLDADTMPYTPGGLDDDEIIYLGGDPDSSTVDGVEIGTGPVVNDEVKPVEVIDPVIFDNVGSGGVTKIVTKTIRPQKYNYRSDLQGGMWDRFASSPYTRFGVAPIQQTQTITSVDQSDGSTLYYDQEGNLIDPNTIA
tara:strand:+ start:122 stop:1351 length:1230 start_codon:yes stop_codon:yes gene_type:complete